MFGKKQARKNLKKRNAKNKKMEQKLNEQDQNELRQVQFYNSFMQGEGPKKHECQDSFTIIDTQSEIFYFFAVFDGHGSSGKEASNAACDNFQQYLEKNLDKMKKLQTDKDRDNFLRNAFKSSERKLKTSGIDYSNSGTCCISVFLQKNGCSIANLGDSRAVLCRITPKDKLAIELSWDHKPTRRDEKERIIKCGGKIERLNYNGEFVGPYRVWADEEGPGIAMTRTLGDLQAKKIGLISVPEINHIELKPGDKFIVIASDGIWDVMNSAEVVGFVLQCPGQDSAAEMLVKEARQRWVDLNKAKKVNNKIGDYPTARRGIDDITVVIAFLVFAIDENPEAY